MSRYFPPFAEESQGLPLRILETSSLTEITTLAKSRYDFKAMKYVGWSVGVTTKRNPEVLTTIRGLKKQLRAIFLLFEEAPITDQEMNEYYAAGIDGVVFLREAKNDFVERLKYAASLWPKGHVMVFFPPDAAIENEEIMQLL